MLAVTAAWLSVCSRDAGAFTVVPDPDAPRHAFVPSEAIDLGHGKSSIITRQPLGLARLPKGGTAAFLAALNKAFPPSEGWTFVSAEKELEGSFTVAGYHVFFNGAVAGAGLSMEYVPKGGDPLNGGDSELHWIQWNMSNHRKGAGHGSAENGIEIKGKGGKGRTPFLDGAAHTRTAHAAARRTPPHYQYDSGRSDLENEHRWLAEVYLAAVRKDTPKRVTIYNGISWGWESRGIAERAQGEPAVDQGP